MPNMDRAAFAVLAVFAVALIRVGDAHGDATGVRGDRGPHRAVWDRLRSRARSQGPLPLEVGAAPDASRSRTPVRLPRGAPASPADGRQTSGAGPAHAAGVSREDQAPAPRDVAQRAARQPASQQQQHRTRVNRRQSSKPGSAHTRRLVG